MNTPYTTLYPHSVTQAEFPPTESSPFQEKVKIFLRHVLSVISSLGLDLRSARLSVVLVRLTVAVTFSMTLRQRGVWASTILALTFSHVRGLGTRTEVRAVSGISRGLIEALSLLLTPEVHGRGVGGELSVDVCGVWRAVPFGVQAVGSQALSSLVDVVVVVAVLGLTLSYFRTCCPLECSTLIGWLGGGLWGCVPVPSFCKGKFRQGKSKTHLCLRGMHRQRALQTHQ